jgi:hypothetical protein
MDYLFTLMTISAYPWPYLQKKKLSFKKIIVLFSFHNYWRMHKPFFLISIYVIIIILGWFQYASM